MMKVFGKNSKIKVQSWGGQRLLELCRSDINRMMYLANNLKSSENYVKKT